MKWYFASRTRHAQKLAEVSRFLAGKGEEVLSTWIHEEGLIPYVENLEKVRKVAAQCVEAISQSDIFVLISDAEGTDMFVELGIALAKHTTQKSTRIYIVGEHSKRSLMQLHPAITHVDNLTELFTMENIERGDFVVPAFE